MELATPSPPRRARRAARTLLAMVAALAACGALVVAVPWPWSGSRLVAGGPTEGYRLFLVGDPRDVRPATRGGMALQGGGTDLDEAFRWLIDRSGGGDVLVLRSSGTDAYNEYIYGMAASSGVRPDSVATLIVESRAAASEPAVLRAIRSAEALWIAGGDQARHARTWRGTPVVDAIHDLVAREVPIGGTSSGLAILGEFAYTAETDGPGDPHLSSTAALRDPGHPRLTVRDGFFRLPLLGRTILEPHFLQESRHGRMAAFLARITAEHPGPEVRGVGIDRKTALLVEPDGSARVIAEPGYPGRVLLFRLAGPASRPEPGRPLDLDGLEVLEFGPGARVDLSGWGGDARSAAILSVEGGRWRVDARAADRPLRRPP